MGSVPKQAGRCCWYCVHCSFIRSGGPALHVQHRVVKPQRALIGKFPHCCLIYN